MTEKCSKLHQNITTNYNSYVVLKGTENEPSLYDEKKILLILLVSLTLRLPLFSKGLYSYIL